MRTGINIPFNYFLKFIAYEDLRNQNFNQAICVNSRDISQVLLDDILIPLGSRSMVKKEDVVSVVNKINKELRFNASIEKYDKISRKDWIIRVKVNESETLG